MLGAAFGVGCVLLAYFIGSLLFDRKTAFFASLILLASPQFAHESRQTMLDVPTTFFILLAAYFLIRGRQKNLYVALAGGAAGLAVLTKFYTGLLSLLLSLLIILLAPKEYLKRKKSVALFFLAFTLIALPWHLLQYQMHGETFIENYFIKQSFGRFAGFEGHDYGRLFYAKVLQKGLSPWMPALPLAVPVLLAFDGRKRKETLTLALWSTLIFVFFSYSRNQLPWYIVYVYPMASIVSARFFAFIDEVIERAGTLIFLAFLITALSLPKVLDCNPCYKAISGISSEYPILVHDSSPRTPGSVFYLGGKRKTTEEILEFEKENGFFIAAVGDAKLFPKATKIFEGQSVVVVVRGLSKEEMLKVFERLHTHDVGSGVCYPYMPPNL
jgi:4-amino-4-deoxy-L-arabinose transferase-like glycosyltransferase